MKRRRWRNGMIVGAVLLAAGCGGPVSEPAAERGPIDLLIVSGSENKELESIIDRFERENDVLVKVTYQGSVDISRELGKGASAAVDAVWPAASLWIALGDTEGVVKHAKSILRSPVVFAAKLSTARQLGWVGRDVSVKDILTAVERKSLRFAMTSATQSNSGASWYFCCLSAFANRPDVLTSQHLEEEGVRDQIRRFLGSVDRSVGSSGWLKTMILEQYDRFEAMVNYEALVIEANRELTAQGKEPLYVVYPVDGVMIADSPLGYVNKGDPEKEALFLKLQEYLLSAETQAQIQRLGRRTGLVGMNPAGVDASVFNPEWGIDVGKILSPIRTPSGDVVREALNLYQTAFRKPSLTAFVLDYSGSMAGEGERQLKEAMRTLLHPELAAQYLLQPSPADVTFVVPFHSAPRGHWKVEGNNPEDLLELLRMVESEEAGGGTHMYLAALEALRLLDPYEAKGAYHAAVILMSDGESKGNLESFMEAIRSQDLSRDIPIYTILFGDASEKQMKPLAAETSGKMFDGRQDVVEAFRSAKGYN